MPDPRLLAKRLEALLDEFSEPLEFVADSSQRVRTTVVNRLKRAVQRLREIEAAVAPALAPEKRIADLVSTAEELAATLPDLDSLVENLNPRKRDRLRRSLDESIHALTSFAARLDPVNQPDAEFDPADPHIIGQLIAKAMIGREGVPLDSLDDRPFYGSGVYALYYGGNFDAYAPVSNTDHPLYVGKADPADIHANTAQGQGQRLWQRLRDHLRSIRSAENLDTSDFECRHLVVRSAWQTTAEDYLIGQFNPIWNTNICAGFGKHGDRGATRRNTVSLWDTLHPGRPWAAREDNVPNPRSADDIKAKIAAHYAASPPGTRIDSSISLMPSDHPTGSR